MAGGMSPGGGRNLASRVAATAHVSLGSARTPRTPARHCYVDGEPALLVEWRQHRGAWEGRVLSMTWVDAVGWATLERWLPAADITPRDP